MARINSQTLIPKAEVKIIMADNLIIPAQFQLLSINHMINRYLSLPHLMKILPTNHARKRLNMC